MKQDIWRQNLGTEFQKGHYAYFRTLCDVAPTHSAVKTSSGLVQDPGSGSRNLIVSMKKIGIL